MSNKTNSLKFQPKTLIRVEMEIDLWIDLPEGIKHDDRDRLSPESAKRAIDAAISLIERKSQVFLDGEGNKPATTYGRVLYRDYAWASTHPQSCIIKMGKAEYKIACTDDRIIDIDPLVDK